MTFPLSLLACVIVKGDVGLGGLRRALMMIMDAYHVQWNERGRARKGEIGMACKLIIALLHVGHLSAQIHFNLHAWAILWSVCLQTLIDS